jgi:hypothetical protein
MIGTRWDTRVFIAAAAVALFLTSAARGAEQRLAAHDPQAADHLGYRVAIDGDVAVATAGDDQVGANVEQGSAVVFSRAAGTWAEEARLIASDGRERDHFGISAGVSGDTIVVGSQRDNGAKTKAGAVYVFTRNGSGWSQEAILTASDGDVADLFGYAVAIQGDTLVVGAPSANSALFPNWGAVYTFKRTGGTWMEVDFLRAADPFSLAEFGISVALDGSTLVVGAHGTNVGLNRAQGAVYAYTRSGNGWVQQARLTIDEGAEFDRFGGAVAVSGDTLAASALPWVGPDAYSGVVYVFARNGGVWNRQATLTPPDRAANDRFGVVLAMSGDVIVAGTLSDDVSGNFNQGSVYVFARHDQQWTQQAKLTSGDGTAGDLLGGSVAISGNDVVAGAYLDDVTALDEGSAYVFQADAPPRRRRSVGR